MSTFSFDAGRESFAKAQNRFEDCFIRQIVPGSLQYMYGRFRIRYVLWFWFPTKVVVAAWVTLMKPAFCSVAKFLLKVRVCVILT